VTQAGPPPTVYAEILCPRPGCASLVAQVLRDGQGRLAVRHRAVVAVAGPLPGGCAVGVETRDLLPPVPVEASPPAGTVQLWFCPCRDARCGSVLVLDVAQVRHLLGYVHRRRAPLRWRPDAAAVERARRLWVRAARPPRPGERVEPVGAPPAIGRGDLRPLRAGAQAQVSGPRARAVPGARRSARRPRRSPCPP
jgi:hypothetical protein